MSLGRNELAEIDALFSGGGELGSLMRAKDWSQTALGPPQHWPQGLKTCVRIILTSRQPMFVWWGSELINLYNDAYKTIVGGKHPACLGQPAIVVWHEIWDAIGPRAEAAMQGNKGTYDEALLLIMERNGYPEETYYTFSYSPVPDDGGGPGGIICANTDDTQRIIGERQLTLLRDLGTRLGEARTVAEAGRLAEQALLGNRRDLPFARVYLADADGNRLRLADQAGAGVAPAEVRRNEPSRWPLFAALDGLQPVLAPSGPDLPMGDWDRSPSQVVVMPLPRQGETGSTGLLVAGLSPYRLYDEGYRRFLGLVTGQIAAGLANADAYERERRRAEALAEIDRAKTTFFSNVSHEFRAPLTLMLGPLEDVLNAPAGSLTAPQRQQLLLAHRNSMRLLRLVNTLLDFSRIEAGRVQATFRPTDLAAMTRDLVSGFQSMLDRAGLRLRIACETLGETVLVDRDMWEKIVLNLVSNAFKFTFEGEIAVQLRRAGEHAELTVRDTGVGIPPGELPHLFERFHRIEGQRGRSFEGSGIGLALVHELVRLHSGTITVASEPDRGSTFTVAIPFGSAHLPADRIAGPDLPSTGSQREVYLGEAARWLPETDANAPDAGTIDAGPIELGHSAAGLSPEPRAKVLLADDNADMRGYISRLLRPFHDVTVAADGRDALAVLPVQKPDLVLTDVMMPNLDGFGLLRAIRQDPALRNVPVILLSARAGEEASIEGLSAGADDYLVKPFSGRELLARVSSNLKLARLRREMMAELERKVAERTAELTAALDRLNAEIAERQRVETTLRQAQKMEAIGHLTGGIAHDFNNLLTAIAGSLELMQLRIAQGRTQDVTRFVNTARSAVDRGAALTHRLLAFARRQALDPRPIDLNQLVADMEDLIRRTVGPGVVLRTELAADLWTTLCDANQLESALLNLCINARDAMPDGGSLTIGTGNVRLEGADEPGLRAGQYVSLWVADTGLGMPPDVIAHVFEPFYTTKPIGQGTGLGLSMLYGFVKQSNGDVRITSEVDKGTTVRLYLPRRLIEAATTGHADMMAPKAAPVDSRRVLVVEDEAVIRSLIMETLSDMGYAAMESDTGPAGLSILQSKTPIDLLITDIGLPGMNGRQLADAARVQRPELKVLFITGYAHNAAMGNGVLEPGMGIMLKPFAMDALVNKIHDMMVG